jgi:GT2 family glycosyltransferase
MNGGQPRGIGPHDNFGAGAEERTVIERRRSVADFPDAFSEAERLAHAHNVQAVIVLGDARLENPATLRVQHIAVRPVDEGTAGEGENAVDADNPAELARLEQEILQVPGPVVLLTTVLEQRRDPRPLLRFVKRLLLAKPGSFAILTGLDRLRTAQFSDRERPGLGCFRQWSAEEAAVFLSTLGFRLTRMESLRASPADANQSAWMAVLSFDRESADAALRRRGLPPSRARTMMIACESAPGHRASGIEAYLREALRPGTENAVLLVLPRTSQSRDRGPEEHWVVPEVFGIAGSTFSPAKTALAAIEQALVEFPDLDQLKCHDWLGVGACVVQARQAGQLPPGLAIEVIAVGTQAFLERGRARWDGFDELKTANDERIAIEGADVVTCPTAFLLHQYSEIGYALSGHSRVCRPSVKPFELDSPVSYEPIDTLVFLGDRDAAHGFPVFADAVITLFAHEKLASLKTVLVLGASDPSTEADAEKLRGLGPACAYVEKEMPRDAALENLRQLAPRALCVMPYLFEALPYAVLEALAAGCQVLASNRSGIAELLPSDVQADVLVEPTVEAIEAALAARCCMSADARSDSVRGTLGRVRADSSRLVSTREVRDETHSGRTRSSSNGSLTVVVPCFNTELSFLADLVWSLNQQARRPARVIFVDDGSVGDFASSLVRLLDEHCRVPFVVLRHSVNRGLSVARNTGLAHVETEYVANLDSDDIAKNDFVSAYTTALDTNPEVAAVTSWLDHFRDGHDWRMATNIEAGAYRPQGCGLALAQVENCLGHANSAYRVDVLRRLGGWDAEDRSMYEDYALHLRLVSGGNAMAVVPRALSLYRVRGDSMVRTYSRFEGEWRLGRNFGAVERFEGLRFQSLVRGSRQSMASIYSALTARDAMMGSLRSELVARGEEASSLRAELAVRGDETTVLRSELTAKVEEASSLRSTLVAWGWENAGEGLNHEGIRPLRYRVADRLNQNLQSVPGLHAVLKWVGRSVLSRIRR